MKTKILFLLILIASFTSFAGVGKTIQPSRSHSFGTPVKFEFYNLTPGQAYRIEVKNMWFSGLVENSPVGFIIDNDKDGISFRAPAKPHKNSEYAVAHFTVGAYTLANRTKKIEIELEAPQPAFAKVIFSDSKITHDFVDNDKNDVDTTKGTITVHIKLPGHRLGTKIDGCFNEPQCNPDVTCPQVPGYDPLTCYGPLQARFYCCWVDPL